jgi:transposase InsO family protein
MRYAAAEKQEIIRTVEESSLGIARTLRQLSIPKSTFYNWYDRYLTGGIEGLADQKPTAPTSWNKVPGEQRQALLEMALEQPSLSPRELAVRFSDKRQYFISEATVYRILKEHDLVTSPAWIVLKAADRFEQPTTAINQLWQTDFTYLKVTGWGWYYLSTVMDDFSRYILAWRLCQTMSAREVTATLKDALKVAGLTKKQRPKLLSDNGPCYISGELQDWLLDHELGHIRGKPYHPMTQGKIERWHRSLKNRILLEHYYLPGDLEQEISAFVTHYNTRRYHESLNNLTPEDVWCGRGQAILEGRRKLKEDTLKLRKQLYYERKTA